MPGLKKSLESFHPGSSFQEECACWIKPSPCSSQMPHEGSSSIKAVLTPLFVRESAISLPLIAGQQYFSFFVLVSLNSSRIQSRTSMKSVRFSITFSNFWVPFKILTRRLWSVSVWNSAATADSLESAVLRHNCLGSETLSVLIWIPNHDQSFLDFSPSVDLISVPSSTCWGPEQNGVPIRGQRINSSGIHYTDISP